MARILLEYDIVDGAIRETHRWVVPDDTAVGEILEMVDNTTSIDRETVRIFSVSEWDSNE